MRAIIFFHDNDTCLTNLKKCQKSFGLGKKFSQFDVIRLFHKNHLRIIKKHDEVFGLIHG
jgi:hypothetical protein